jgi:hypothetical protein
VTGWYHSFIQEPGRAGVLFMLVFFGITFVITRTVTRRIHSKGQSEGQGADGEQPTGLVKDIHIGGVHIHHQVWGILLILITAALEFSYQPKSPWIEVLGALFGIGAALTLDEFALWLHLEDVYWTTSGRKSIDAVVVAVALMSALLLGSTPFGVAQAEDGPDALVFAPAVVVVFLVFVLVCIAKGKLIMGLIGVFLPIVAIIGAIRLARPSSVWARRRYAHRPGKMAKAEARDSRHEARMDRVRDFLGGTSGAADDVG